MATTVIHTRVLASLMASARSPSANLKSLVINNPSRPRATLICKNASSDLTPKTKDSVVAPSSASSLPCSVSQSARSLPSSAAWQRSLKTLLFHTLCMPSKWHLEIKKWAPPLGSSTKAEVSRSEMVQLTAPTRRHLSELCQGSNHQDPQTL